MRTLVTVSVLIIIAAATTLLYRYDPMSYRNQNLINKLEKIKSESNGK